MKLTAAYLAFATFAGLLSACTHPPQQAALKQALIDQARVEHALAKRDDCLALIGPGNEWPEGC